MKNLVSKVIRVLWLSLLITSCKSTVAIYDMNANVDAPTDVTVKYSDTKQINMKPDIDFSNHSVDEDLIDAESIMVFHYEDNLIHITSLVSIKIC